MFGPVTDNERRGWQRASLAALSGLLAEHRNLPPVTWQVGGSLSVQARLSEYERGCRTEADRREVLAAYARALDTDVTEQRYEQTGQPAPGSAVGTLRVEADYAPLRPGGQRGRPVTVRLVCPLYAPDQP
jgi:hypothetical protein